MASPDPSLLRPKPSKTSDGSEVFGRVMAIRASQGQVGAVEWVGLDPTSWLPVDLQQYATDNSSSSSSGGMDPVGVKVRYREAFEPTSNYLQVTAEISDAQNGVIRFPLVEEFTSTPGVYIAEIAFLYPAGHVYAGKLIFSNMLYVAVDRGAFGDPVCGGPYTMQELRMALRDSSPEDSYLNDSLEWDAAEYCQALIRPIEWFNNERPPVKNYTTRNFPFREAWLQGSLAILYSIAAAFYRREAISYSAAGVSLNDRAKAPEYEQMAQMYEKKFRDWVRHKKNQINLRGGYGSTRC